MKITPQNAFEIISSHMLIDHFDMVLDLDKSHGVWAYDSKYGKKYLDLFSFFASNPVGYNHPKIIEDEFVKKIVRVALHKPSNSDIITIEMAEFIDAFYRFAGLDFLPYIFLVEGGALGIENALKASFDWKIKKNFKKGYREEKGTKVLHFKECFHGRTGYTMSLTNTDPVKTALYPKFDWPRVTNPKIKFPLNEKNLEEVKKLEEQAVKEIKEAFQKHKDDIVAIIIEPIQGEGGDNHFRGEFLQQLRTLADENDCMLIFDEVQTGVGLTGKMWAFQHFDVKPDMLCFGKKIQLGGFISSKKIDEVEDNVFHTPGRVNSTWGGNLTDMLRGARYLEIIKDEKLDENASIVGDYFLKKLQEIQEEMPELVSNVRGRGLMIAFDLPNPDMRNKLHRKIFENGALALKSGEKSIRFRPPLIINKDEVDEGIRIIRKSLKEIA
ncbi:MAG: L-lysine 6-transaminase [Candidatus Aminicenantia bacterium]